MSWWLFCKVKSYSRSCEGEIGTLHLELKAEISATAWYVQSVVGLLLLPILVLPHASLTEAYCAGHDCIAHHHLLPAIKKSALKHGDRETLLGEDDDNCNQDK